MWQVKKPDIDQVSRKPIWKPQESQISAHISAPSDLYRHDPAKFPNFLFEACTKIQDTDLRSSEISY
jgi:hypothetical protein